MADTHITSGVVTVGSGLALVGSGMNVNVINTVNANISGQHIITNDGQLVVVASGHIQVDNFPTTSISGQSVQTSISGNSIAVYDGGLAAALSGLSVMTTPAPASDPVVICGMVQITGSSGGVQLPNQPCRSGVIFISMSTGGEAIIGGQGNNAPYWVSDSNMKGQIWPYSIASPVPITNMDQINVVTQGIVASGGLLQYIAFT